MERSRRATYAFLILALMICFVAICMVSVDNTEVVKSYNLIKMFDDGAPVYISHQGLGYYYSYEIEDGHTDEFISNEKVRTTDYTEDGSPPRVEYVYSVRHYEVNFFGRKAEFDSAPYLDAVRFLVPEGAIAEM